VYSGWAKVDIIKLSKRRKIYWEIKAIKTEDFELLDFSAFQQQSNVIYWRRWTTLAFYGIEHAKFVFVSKIFLIFFHPEGG
jgi:hypothetical protein